MSGDGAGGGASGSSGPEAAVSIPTVTVHGLAALLPAGECDNAQVHVSGISPATSYDITLTTQGSNVGLNAGCHRSLEVWWGLRGRGSYRVGFPLVSCAPIGGTVGMFGSTGTVTVEVRDVQAGITVASTVIDVMQAPPPYDHVERRFGHDVTDDDMCVISSRHTTGENGVRTRDGVAHYGAVTFFTGTHPLSASPEQGILSLCVVGMVEGFSSHGDVKFTLGGLLSMRAGGNQASRSLTSVCLIYRNPCRVLVGTLQTMLEVGAHTLITRPTNDDIFRMSGTHRVESGRGLHSAAFITSVDFIVDED